MVEMTFRGAAGRLVEIGMISAERRDAVLAPGSEEVLGLGFGADEELDTADVLDVLAELGLAVYVHGEDVDDLEESYQEILEQAAACSGGALRITDVELVRDEEGAERLEFRLNGADRHWNVEHQADDYLDQLAVWEYIDDLDPGGDDPRIFHPVPGDEPGEDDFYVLATPEQARALEAGFGLKIEIRDGAGGAE